MTAEQIARIKITIDQYYRLLRKEMRYSPKHRKQDVIDRYNAEIARLENMMSTR